MTTTQETTNCPCPCDNACISGSTFNQYYYGEGVVPTIGENGNWFIGDTDTGVKAQGTDGITPHIGENNNWFIGDTDTGVKALGTDGAPGVKGDKGDTGAQGPIGPQGPKGDTGSAFSQVLLYNGSANQTATTYTLSAAVTNYSYLIIELSLNNKDTGWGAIQYTMLFHPVVSSLSKQYSWFQYDYEENNTANRYGAAWHFPTGNTFIIDWLGKGDTSNANRILNDCRISKIYGVI